MKTLNKILTLLSLKERKQAIFLLVMILLMALLDTLGVASIMPFIAVLANPDLIQTNIFINNLLILLRNQKIKFNFSKFSKVLIEILLFKYFLLFLSKIIKISPKSFFRYFVLNLKIFA